jgi:hypothetical protein
MKTSRFTLTELSELLKMLDERIARLQADFDEAQKAKNFDDQVEACFRREEAKEIRQMVMSWAK